MIDYKNNNKLKNYNFIDKHAIKQDIFSYLDIIIKSKKSNAKSVEIPQIVQKC